jgi:PIN domain nuclease of toxin-antitoxin system
LRIDRTRLASAASAWEITTKARLGKLPGEHRDPFDRMLIAQSQMEDVALVTDDEAFDAFEVRRLW